MKLHYECEICGYVYPEEWMAILCESKALTPPKYCVGDEIGFNTRYDGVAHDRVESIVVRQGPWCSPMSGWAKDEARFMSKVVAEINRNPDANHFHQWSYGVKEQHQLGKDWWTNFIPESSVKERRAENASTI